MMVLIMKNIGKDVKTSFLKDLSNLPPSSKQHEYAFASVYEILFLTPSSRSQEITDYVDLAMPSLDPHGFLMKYLLQDR